MLGRKTKISAGVALAFAGALMFSACAGGSGGELSSTPDTDDGVTASPSETAMETMDPMADLVGAGCADYAAQVPDGAGSVEGMSQDPVATAASNNPILTQLTALVGQAGLVDTLNSGEFTVFAPIDSAFAALDPATVSAVTSDNTLLTSVLTYHVLPERLNPDEIDGTHATVNGADLEVTGSGDDIVVNGSATVVCGGVQTANATVYLIDAVLMPPM